MISIETLKKVIVVFQYGATDGEKENAKRIIERAALERGVTMKDMLAGRFDPVVRMPHVDTTGFYGKPKMHKHSSGLNVPDNLDDYISAITKNYADAFRRQNEAVAEYNRRAQQAQKDLQDRLADAQRRARR